MIRLLSKMSNLFFTPDVAIDLGTANTRLFAAGRGLIADSPSVVGIDRQSETGPGSNGFKSGGQQGKYQYVRPLRGGVVTDVAAASKLLGQLLRKIHRFNFTAPRVIVCAPSDVSEEEREALVEANRRAGASAVAVVSEPLAAAIGAGLDISSPYARMIVDVGEGVTDIAVVREGNLIQTAAIRIAGSDLRRAVEMMLSQRHQIRFTTKQLEFLTHRLGAAAGAEPQIKSLPICGVKSSGGKAAVTVKSEEVCEAINPVIAVIAETVRREVGRMPPEICAEIVETGICLTGGVAALPGIAEFISAETNLEVKPAPDPPHSVINGASLMLKTAAETNLWLV